MRAKLAVAGLLLAIGGAGCDDGIDDPVVIKGRVALVGTWTGTAEITTAEDIGPQDGTVFPVLLDLDKDGRFELITSNYPASFTDPSRRVCFGFWEREGATLELFPVEACRALPFARYTIGRTFPDGLTLDASTATSPVHTPGSIRIRMRLDRT